MSAQTGDMISHSPMTGHVYRVTEWEHLGGNKIRAIRKERMKFAVVDDSTRDEDGYLVDEWVATRHEAIGIATIRERETGGEYSVYPAEWLTEVDTE